MERDELAELAQQVASRRNWGADINTDAMAKAYFDCAVACMLDFAEEVPSSFRAGVRAAIQATVDDLAELVKRRHLASANETITQVIVGIARRIAGLGMPVTEDQATAPLDRMVLVAKVARLILNVPHWERVASVSAEGVFAEEDGTVLDMSDAMREAWQKADEIVTLTRYA